MKEYDVIVVGSGAGGSTVAREMALKGRRVLMLERGGRVNMMGNTMTAAMTLDILSLLKNYRDIVIMGNNYGGLSNITAGCAIGPSEHLFAKYGIDLTREAEEARKDLWVQKLPDEMVGMTNMRILEAANSIGYKWEKFEKFIDVSVCAGSANCMLGCKTGAKWTARVYGDEAASRGADIKLHNVVTRVLVEDGRAIGVEGKHFGRKVKYYGKTVVLSSGMSNVHILRNAGIRDAGEGLCCDWLQFVGGIIPGVNNRHESPMSVGTLEHYEEGLAILPVIPNWAMFAAITALAGVTQLPRLADYRKYSGIMVKVRDDTTGRIGKGRSFVKPVTVNDRKKLNMGVDIIKKIFKAAGAGEDGIHVMKEIGAHPSATCRIGTVVDSNLETRIRGLYCCDASVFPASLGTPVVWTVVSLGKRLSKRLDSITG